MFYPKLPFEVLYEKLKYPIFPTTRINRFTNVYRVGRLCNVFVAFEFAFVGQILSLTTRTLGELLTDTNKYLLYFDIREEPLPQITEATLDDINEARDKWLTKMRQFYDRPKTRQYWKEKHTSMLLLLVMNCNMVLKKDFPLLE